VTGTSGTGRAKGLAVTRRAVQSVFLILFAVLAFETAYQPLKLPAANIMLRFDPIAAVYAAISTHSASVVGAFWPAWILLGLTLLSGRFFCGWICPLGTCFDAAGAVKPKALKYYKPGGKEIRSSRSTGENISRKHRLAWLRPKYILLALVLGLAFARVNLLYFASPMAVMNRTAYYVLLPAVPLFFIALVLLAFFYRPRFWCESICPAGALMSAVSAAGKKLPEAASPLSVVKDPPECISCGACYRECDFGVSEPLVSGRAGRLQAADCSLCSDCVSSCPARGALALKSFGLPLYVSGRRRERRTGEAPEPSRAAGRAAGAGKRPSTEQAHVDSRFVVSRGEFVGSLAAGGLLLAGYGLGISKNTDTVLRMPGAQDESLFLSRCNRCLACARACPTGCLKPMGLGSGLQKLWTPRFVPREAGCVFDQCGQACQTVCPAGAIERVEPAKVKIGTAHVNTRTCLGYNGRSCLVCKERCRFNAIRADGLRPRVSENICTGCGACEETCPTRASSIVVSKTGAAPTWQDSGGNGKRRGGGT
jgi:ferredoxin